MMQMPRFITADEVEAVAGGVAGGVIDLAEYAHPSGRVLAWEHLPAARAGDPSAPLAVILPNDADPHEFERAARSGAAVIVINDAESAPQIERAGALLDRQGGTAGLVPRLTSGRGLHAASELAAAHRRVAGLWYAVADLLVDFDDEPPMPYYYDSGESRLAAPAWTRSRLLTIARAAGIALWGQLDLSFAGAPPDHQLQRAARLARLSGFDVLVTRRPFADAALAGDG